MRKTKKETIKRIPRVIYQIDFKGEDVHGNEKPDTCTVGNAGVVEIKETQAQGEGDKWRWEIFFDHGITITLFNADKVYRKPLEKEG